MQRLLSDESLFRIHENDILLESSIIKMVDGLSMGINGAKIAMMLKVRKEVKKMLFGVPDATGAFVGLFMLHDTKRTLLDLVDIEDEYKKTNDLEGQKAVAHLVVEARNHFITHIKPFMATARGAKRQMLMLIEESCKKRKRFDSILLRWGAAREDEEEKQFHKDVIDFKTFNIFCSDLIHFMEDIIRSCPKAVAQFKQMIERETHKG